MKVISLRSICCCIFLLLIAVSLKPVDAGVDSSSGTEISAHPQCQAGNTKVCVKLVIQKMKIRLKQLGCHHNAIFALTYLLTTEVFLDTAEELPYEDLASVVREDALFADYYFRAYDAYYNGDPADVPPAWQIAFDAADNKSVLSIGNALLGISAHINNDLPQVLFDLYKNGTPVSEADHNLVNVFLAQVVVDVPVQESYDPTYPPTIPPPEGQPSEVEVWRTVAWQNYLALVAADASGQAGAVEAVVTQIETVAATFATQFAFAFANPPGTDSTQRDAFCAAQNNGNV